MKAKKLKGIEGEDMCLLTVLGSFKWKKKIFPHGHRRTEREDALWKLIKIVRGFVHTGALKLQFSGQTFDINFFYKNKCSYQKGWFAKKKKEICKNSPFGKAKSFFFCIHFLFFKKPDPTSWNFLFPPDPFLSIEEVCGSTNAYFLRYYLIYVLLCSPRMLLLCFFRMKNPTYH